MKQQLAMKFLTLDTHGHLAVKHSPKDLKESGAVLAMTLSLDEATLVIHHKEPNIVWGVGCHP